MLNDLRASGISVAAIHYRFVTKDPFPAPMHDGARAVQFLRAKAGDFNIDPKRIACFGNSAGAGMSLWLAFHDDLAKPDSKDPVERHSTRLACAGSSGGQTTYNPRQIMEWMAVATLDPHPSLYPFYGIFAEEELEQPEKQKLVYDASPISHVNAGDPPVYLSYTQKNEPVTEVTPPNQYIHHPIFGVKLKDVMDAKKLECILKVGVPKQTANRGLFEFLCKHLGAQPKKAE